jgi:hypothetical protein
MKWLRYCIRHLGSSTGLSEMCGGLHPRQVTNILQNRTIGLWKAMQVFAFNEDGPCYEES